MTFDRSRITPSDVSARLHALFEAAKSTDEFEYACTLLRVRGLEDAGWDPFVETHLLVEDLTALINAPLRGDTQVRLGLLLYSHLTEVGAVYETLANLALVVAGERYSIDPFTPDYPHNRRGEPQFLSARGKVGALKKRLKQAGHAEIGELLDWFFKPAVRNAFAHADYTLHDGKFRSRSERFEIGGLLSSELPLDVLAEVFNRSLTFYEAFVNEYGKARSGYGANKVISGRIAGDEAHVPVELMAHPQKGLYGLRSPPRESPTGSTSNAAASSGRCRAD
jgi:hypothetical protein